MASIPFSTGRALCATLAARCARSSRRRHYYVQQKQIAASGLMRGFGGHPHTSTGSISRRLHTSCAAPLKSTAHCAPGGDVDVRMVPPSWRDDGGGGGGGRLVNVKHDEAATAASSASTSTTPSTSYAAASFRPNSRTRLSPSDVRRFRSDDTFDRVARAVCEAGCLPRKELYETWEAALIISQSFGRVGTFHVVKTKNTIDDTSTVHCTM
jgi:hypothetical protein